MNICKVVLSENPHSEMFRELSLFEQTGYCKKHIKEKATEVDDRIIELHSEIASACFRQAREYYDASKNVSLSTKPLLYAYSLNNYTKGIAYLSSNDITIIKGFEKHGLKYPNNDFLINKQDDFLQSVIKIQQYGAVASLEKMVQDKEIKANTDIELYKLCSLIPDFQSIFETVTNFKSNIAKSLEWTPIFEIILPEHCANIDEYIKMLDLLQIKIDRDEDQDINKLSFCLSYEERQHINELKGLPVITDNKLILPIVVDSEPVLVHPMVASYLIIMSYSMLVRYHAEKWDSLIDSKKSNMFSFIKFSLEDCYNEFYTDMYLYIFNQRLIKKEYDDESVKKCLEHNRSEITEIVSRELHQQIQLRARSLGLK